MSESQTKAMILGVSGPRLTSAEAEFFRRERPWGFILFARNIVEPEQVRELSRELRACIDSDDAPILIDQEGGRVQRFRPPLAPNYPPAAAIGALYGRDRSAGLRAAWLQGRLHAFDLRRYGANVDCLPVLDVPTAGAHDVIGDRAYAKDPQSVAAIGRSVAEGLLAGGVLPVVKHMPGHGRADADTHHSLPTVHASVDALRDHDFVPFKAMSDVGMAMTAHVVYAAIDPDRPATTSPTVIGEIIRGEIGFDGLLMSDDVSMKALSGDFGARTRAILASGCDLVLHCNGVMDEMAAVAGAAKPLEGRSLERARAAVKPLGRRDTASEADARAEFASFFQAIA